MSFIAKNPLTIPKVSKAPSAPIQGARGLFAKEDGWYDIDDSGNERKIISEDDLSAEIPEVIDNLTSTDTDKALSANQGKVLNDGKADKQNSTGGFEGGLGASSFGSGAAIGSAATESGGGAALGEYSTENAGGGAVGSSATVTDGGGAVGCNAATSSGFAGGKDAKTQKSPIENIDAIQLGTGTNSTPKSLQVYNYQLMDADGNIPLERLNNAPKTEVVDGLESTDTDKALSANQGKVLNDGKADKATTLEGYGIADAYTKTEVDAELAKKADREEMFDKLCPHGEAESTSATVTVTDGLGGTVLRDWSITGAEGGVGDLNSETGKYDIPVTVRGQNLFKPQMTEAILPNTKVSIRPYEGGKLYISGQPNSGYFNYISLCQPCAFSSGTSNCTQVNDVIVPKGNNFVISWEHISGDTSFEYIVLTDSSGTARGITISYAKGYALISARDYDVCNIYFRFPHGNTGYTLNDVYRFQVTLGTEVLPFEPYGEPQTVTVSPDAPLGAGESIGKINTGIDIPLVTNGANIIDVSTAVAPGKVAIDYYKDINTVLNNITNAILSQGGNV